MRFRPDAYHDLLNGRPINDLIARIPILMLVDGDPYGFEIASVYKFGSVKMKHAADELACPRGELLGIRMGDINR